MLIDLQLKNQVVDYLWKWYANKGLSLRCSFSIGDMVKELECSKKALQPIISNLERNGILTFRGMNTDECRLTRAPDSELPPGLTGDYVKAAEAVSAELRKRWKDDVENKRIDFEKLAASLRLNSDLVSLSLKELEADNIVISNRSSKLPQGIYIIQTAPPLPFKPSKRGLVGRDEPVEL